MKKTFALPAIFGLAILAILFPGCIKDTCKQTYTYTFYKPVYKTKDEVRANIKSNPAKEVKNPGKLYVIGNYVLLNEIDKGIHVIDNSNPSSPNRVAFIDIPGNVDIAVKGTTLYADLYTDLVAIDISNPAQVSVKKIVEGVFPFRNWGMLYDSTKIIIDWEKRDTVIKQVCDNPNWWVAERDVFFNSALTSGGGGGNVSASPIGVGGSMARFTIMSNRLYTVSYSDINVFNITNAEDPGFVRLVDVGTWDVETIYPFSNKLFLGSRSGMHIYDVSNPDNPVRTGTFTHVRSCDPVIAENDYAYVTLRSGTACLGFTNQLDIVRISNISNPTLVKTYQLSNPHGLSKVGNTLLICDGADGLKVFNAADPNNLQQQFRVAGINAFDVIALGNLAIVVAKDGLYQYDISDPSNVRQLSKIIVSSN